ncbi:hypothetical protein [Fodinibius saliphilus]|uniref:hypothetical protein n=1 Tax=Fodinibius saliphilus TaxID=1920650 RepID=UPI001107EBA9|nr:hypothetical protein [Fodinibius saliphilus]
MGLNKLIPKLFGVLLLGIVTVGIYWGYSINSDSSEQTEDYYFRYSKKGEMDEYENGDTYGYTIEVSFSADYTLYKQIYSESNGERKIKETEIKQGSLSKDTFDELSDLLSQTPVSAFPSTLPDVDPREVMINTPAPRVEVSVRLERGKEPVTVKANMGADREYYPDQFLKLTEKLGKILRKVQETS